MNPLLLLMGLLLLAYLGSFLVGEHSIRGVGLPSGTEYIVLGFVLGPNALGLVERSMLETFDPIADVAVGWIALLIGFGFGIEGGERARGGAILGGSLIGLFTGGVIFATLWFVTGELSALHGVDRILVVGGIAAACSETTRQAVRWVTERHAASGPLATLLGELTQSDDLVPILAVAALFGFSTPAHVPWAVSPWVWGSITLGFGVVLGAMAAFLLGREFRRNESWGLLLGLAVMGIGITARLGLSSIGTMFAMGGTTAFLSRHRASLREMVSPTDRTVLHPALLLAGAHVEPRASGALAFIVLFTIAARMSAKGVCGVALGAFSPAARSAGPVLGLGLLCSGALSMTIGLAFALRFPGPVGDTVLATAAALTVLGEFVGPWGLRSALRQAGEIRPSAAAPPDRGDPRMSSGGGAHAAPKGFLTRLVQASALVVLFAVLYGATRAVPTIQSRVGTIAAVGFLLLAGTITSELVEVVGLPHLTGYLAAGIIAGPHVLRLIDEHSVVDLTSVNALALALIALEGGAHLRIDTLRKGVRSLAWATLLQSLVGLVVMMLVFVSLRRFIPFADKLTTSALIGTGLLWGTLAITRSPSATLGIMSQTRAKGPVMTGTLSFVMTSDVVVVVLLATAMVIARPLIDPTATFSMHDFEELGHDVFGSVALGTTLGLILAIYMRLVGRQLLVVFLALGFGMSELLAFLRFDTLLAFMVAGFVVQNLSKQGEKFIAAIEQTGSIVYVIFFATAGAHLDLDLLRQLWPIAVALAGSRLLVTLLTGRVASRLAKDSPSMRRWAWAGLVSQAGLALGVAAVIERSFPVLGSGFRALSIAVVALNEMVGPVLFKLALDRAGESSREPQPSLPSIELAARASKAHLQVDARVSQDPAAHS